MLLPDLQEKDVLNLLKLEPKQHFTQPPARYSEATLVKALEENGVGRPSTYASILSTIQDKEYVQLLQRKFFPTDLGKLVTELLVNHFPAIMNVDFTASMEQQLDQVEDGSSDWKEVLKGFYNPFRESLETAKSEMKSVKKSAIPTDIKCSKCDGIMVIKWGRMGEFLACEKYPDCKNTQDFTRESDGNIIAVEKEEDQKSGDMCDKCGRPMVYKNGRFGRFLACSGYPDCKNTREVGSAVNGANGDRTALRVAAVVQVGRDLTQGAPGEVGSVSGLFGLLDSVPQRQGEKIDLPGVAQRRRDPVPHRARGNQPSRSWPGPARPAR